MKSPEVRQTADKVRKGQPAEVTIPIVEETATISKSPVEIEHVRLHTEIREHDMTVRDTVKRDTIAIERVAVEREVDAPPPVREDDGVTIVSVIEERLVVEKRLFLVEEIHLRRTTENASVELPITLRRTHVDVERHDLSKTIGE